MRVAHFVQRLHPYGEERLLLALCKYRGPGIEPPLVVSAEEGVLGDALRAAGCEVHVEQQPESLARQLARADLVNAHLARGEAGLQVLPILRRAGRPFVFTLHCPAASPLVAGLICICTSAAAHRVHSPGAVCELAETGIDLQPYASARRELSPDRFVITRICRPEESSEYFWHAMTSILAWHPNVEVQSAGSPVRMEGRVRAVGIPADVTPLLKQTDLFVYAPRAGEGSGTVLMEAMAMGVPAVVADVEMARSCALPGRTALFYRPGDTEALAAAIEILIRDEELRQRLGEAAREHAFKRFDARKHAPQFESIYQRLLNGGYRPPARRRSSTSRGLRARLRAVRPSAGS